jgi:hypothetical protein
VKKPQYIDLKLGQRALLKYEDPDNDEKMAKKKSDSRIHKHRALLEKLKQSKASN